MYSIRRHLEQIASQRAGNSRAILLTGPRRVGKTTLLGHLFCDASYVSMDNDLLLSQAEEDAGLFLQNNPAPLILGEVQKCPALLRRLKMIQDSTEQRSCFYLTASQEPMENAGHFLAMEMAGLSLREIHGVDFNLHFVPSPEYLAQRETHLKKYPATIWETIHRGSFPELYASPAPEWSEFYRSWSRTSIVLSAQSIIRRLSAL